MSNIIEQDGRLIGYYADLNQYLKQVLPTLTEDDQWEEARNVVDLIIDLYDYVDHEGLLVIDDNNGMGNTISKYEGD